MNINLANIANYTTTDELASSFPWGDTKSGDCEQELLPPFFAGNDKEESIEELKLETKEIQPLEEKPQPTRGIPNLGNTCWLATLLQLFCTTSWYQSILDGQIHDFKDEEERQKYASLQSALREAVNSLKEPTLADERKQHIVTLLQKLVDCHLIAEGQEVEVQEKVKGEKEEQSKKKTVRRYEQYDSTEILTKMLLRLGVAPEVVVDRIMTYTDQSVEVRKNLEQNSFLPLQVTRENQTVTSLVDEYFGQEEGRTVKFTVQDAKGNVLKTVDGSYGRTGACPPIFLRLGKKASQKEIQQAQVSFLKKANQLVKDAEFSFVEREGKNSIEAVKEGKVVASFPADSGLTENAPVYVTLGKARSEEEVQQEQMAYLKEQNYGSEAVVVSRAEVKHMQRKIAALPDVIELRANVLAGSLEIEDVINLAPYSLPQIEKEKALYELTACICRSGAHENEAGGHFWYYKKEATGWMAFNDSSVNSVSAGAQMDDFKQHGYAFFYQRKTTLSFLVLTEGEEGVDFHAAYELRELHGV